MRVRDPACVYKLAMIVVGHAGVHSSGRAVASWTVSPITKLAIASQKLP